jgi:hypothetical protein
MNNNDYIKSSPYFFRMIGITAVLTVIFISVLSVIFHAPLQEAAEPFNVPNPSKSAWYLLWMQEITSYHVYFIYFILFMFVFFTALPFMAKPGGEAKASWFDGRFRLLMIITFVAFAGIIILTLIGYFLRGPYWQIML